MKSLIRLLLLFVGLGFVVPLTYWFGIFGIPVWSIPFAALLLVQAGGAVARGTYRFAPPDLFEKAVLVFIVMMTLSTVLHPSVAELGANKLFVYSLTLGLAVYAKRHFGDTVTMERLAIFACLLIAVQFAVCIAQYVTQSAIGDVKAYFGTTRAEDLETGLVQAALGIGRVVGTLGGSPNLLGRAIVIFVPFVAASGTIFSGSKDRPLYYVGQRVVMAMAVVVVLLTVSRSSIAVLLLLTVLAVLRRTGVLSRAMSFFYTTRRRLVSRALLVVLTGALLGAVFSNSQFRESVSNTLQTIQIRVEQIGGVSTGAAIAASPLGDRLLLNIGAIKMFLDGPIILGQGYHNTLRVAKKTNIQGVKNPELRVHNAPLQFLAEGGIIAFFAFLVIVIYPLYLNLSAYPDWGVRDRAFVASVGSILLLMQTSTTYDSVALAPLYGLILGCAVGHGLELRNRANMEQQ